MRLQHGTKEAACAHEEEREEMTVGGWHDMATLVLQYDVKPWRRARRWRWRPWCGCVEKQRDQHGSPGIARVEEQEEPWRLRRASSAEAGQESKEEHACCRKGGAALRHG